MSCIGKMQHPLAVNRQASLQEHGRSFQKNKQEKFSHHVATQKPTLENKRLVLQAKATLHYSSFLLIYPTDGISTTVSYCYLAGRCASHLTRLILLWRISFSSLIDLQCFSEGILGYNPSAAKALFGMVGICRGGATQVPQGINMVLMKWVGGREWGTSN